MLFRSRDANTRNCPLKLRAVLNGDGRACANKLVAAVSKVTMVAAVFMATGCKRELAQFFFAGLVSALADFFSGAADAAGAAGVAVAGFTSFFAAAL